MFTIEQQSMLAIPCDLGLFVDRGAGEGPASTGRGVPNNARSGGGLFWAGFDAPDDLRLEIHRRIRCVLVELKHAIWQGVHP